MKIFEGNVGDTFLCERMIRDLRDTCSQPVTVWLEVTIINKTECGKFIKTNEGSGKKDNWFDIAGIDTYYSKVLAKIISQPKN